MAFSHFFNSVLNTVRWMVHLRFLSLSLLFTNVSSAMVDSNSNGMSDLWERLYNHGNLLPSSFLPQSDADGDGVENLLECIAATDPFDGAPPDGFFQAEVTHIPAVYLTSGSGGTAISSPEAFIIHWQGHKGKNYELFYSADLSPGGWISIQKVGAMSDGEIRIAVSPEEAGGTTPDRLFFKVSAADEDDDGDGFNNWEEAQKGTDQTVPDHDEDGLPDDWETSNNLNYDDNGGTNPNNGPAGDPDSDGLNNLQEWLHYGNPRDADTDDDGLGDALEALTYHTNLEWWDTDYDGLSDYEEAVVYGTNPLKMDEDRDSLDDFEEIMVYGTDPKNPDTDGDTMNDDWEVDHGFDPLVPNPIMDPDNDGLGTSVELLLHLDPMDSDTDDDGRPDGAEDYDKDTLTNVTETTVHHTNPKSPDTDRDGLPDAWEIANNLSPRSAAAPNGTNHDPDHDGLTNYEEWLNVCKPTIADSDGDGVTDGVEVDQGSNPNDPGDGGHPPPPEDVVEVPFTVSDPSSSESEKWILTVRGLGPEDYRSQSLASPAFGQKASEALKLRKGNRYEVTVAHDGTDPEYLEDNDDKPDYDWEATVDGKPTSTSEESNAGAPGVNNYFVANGHWLVDNRQAVFTTEKGGDDTDMVTGHTAILIPALQRDKDALDDNWKSIAGNLAKSLPGQKINLRFDSSILGYNFACTDPHWTIPQKIFKDYVANANSAVLTEVGDSDLTNFNTSFYFTDSGEKSIILKFSINNIPIQLEETIHVEKPVASFTPKLGEVRFNTNAIYFTFGLHHNNNSPLGGLGMYGSVAPPQEEPQGIWHWVQIVTSYRSKTNTSGQVFQFTMNGQRALDTYPVYGSDHPTDGREKATGDSPAMTCPGWQSVSATDQFELYQMFRPDGVESRLVPLNYVTWGWNGTATKAAAGDWSISSASPPYCSEVNETTTHPIWDKNIANGVQPGP